MTISNLSDRNRAYLLSCCPVHSPWPVIRPWRRPASPSAGPPPPHCPGAAGPRSTRPTHTTHHSGLGTGRNSLNSSIQCYRTTYTSVRSFTKQKLNIFHSEFFFFFKSHYEGPHKIVIQIYHYYTDNVEQSIMLQYILIFVLVFETNKQIKKMIAKQK